MKYILLILFIPQSYVFALDIDYVTNSVHLLAGDYKCDKCPETHNFYMTCFVFHENKDRQYLITCGHAPKDINNIRVRPYINGKFTKDIPATIVFKHEGKFNENIIKEEMSRDLYEDLMIISIPLSGLNKLELTEGTPESGYTYGCPGGKEPTVKRVKYKHGTMIEINSHSICGRSGSPIFDMTTNKVYGIICFTNSCENRSMAQSTRVIQKILKDKQFYENH